MAYASGFDWDIFVSYAHSDDEAGAGDGKRWVREVVARLKSALSIHLGGRQELAVFFDDHEFKGGKQLSDLLAAAGRSAIFLAIASPAYAKRDWTQQELATFCQGTSDLRRLFAIEYYPLPAGANYPEPLQSHRREPFWRRDEPHVTIPVPVPADDRSLFPTIMQLADLIYKELDRLKGAPPPPAEPEAGGEVVFLAQTTDDLEDERVSVRRELEQYGYRVVPEYDYPQGGEEFRAAMEADLAAAAARANGSAGLPLFVQLLGPRAGRRPADLPEGYPSAQFDIARRLGCEMMLWRRPDLDLDAVSDEGHKALLGNENMIASGLSNFKSDIRERLEARKRRVVQPSSPPAMVFINADRNDREAAGIVRREFGKLDMPVFEPLYEGTPEEVHADLKGKIEDCEVLILLFGKAPLSWIHSQARLYQKLRAGTRARMVVVCVGPPPDAKPQSPDDLGFTLPGLKWVETREEWKIEPMLQLLSGTGKPLH